MNNDLVSIVITTRNRCEDVKQCIGSLVSSTYPDHEIILVDNASGDGTVEAVQEFFPGVRVVSHKENLGIAGGRNAGARIAKGEYILFLDSDTTVDKAMLEELVKVLKADPAIGIVVPKMYFFAEPDRLWFAGAQVNLLTSQTKNIGVGEKDMGQYDRITEVSHGPTAFLCRRQVNEAIGGHDEDYFMSYADMDFAQKAKHKGFQVVCAPKAKLWHKISVGKDRSPIRDLLGTFPFRAYYFSRNRYVFMKKIAPKINLILFLLIFAPAFFLIYVLRIIAYKRGDYLRMYLQGTVDGLRYVVTGKLPIPVFQKSGEIDG